MTTQGHLGVKGHAAEPGSMPTGDLVGLAGLGEPFGCVLAQRLQHPVASGRTGLHEHHRAPDETAQGFQDFAVLRLRVAHDVLGSGERPSASEDRQPVEDALFTRGEQCVAPVDRGSQRLLARLCGPDAGGQQREALVESAGDVGG